MAFRYWPLVVLILAAGCARSNGLDAIKQRGVLRIGGDHEGDAPYIIEGKDGKLTGFEVELGEYLASKLGVRAEFVHRTWTELPQELRRTTDPPIDCIINGYEWSRNRAQIMGATIPYYVYRLQLLARKDDASIQSWDDLRGKKVGVLSDSAAHRYLENRFGKEVEIQDLSEEATTVVMWSVQKRNLDATVQDLPQALYYVGPDREFPGLRFVGEGVEPGNYVIYVRKEDGALRDLLDQALRDGMADGTLRRIYERYGLWNADQEKLPEIAEHWPPPGGPGDTDWLLFISQLGQAAAVTVFLSFASMPLAIVAGLLIALGRLFGPPLLKPFLAAYVEIIRGTPLLLQLFVIYYLPPNALGFSLDPLLAGVLALAINYSAYEAEIYRAGLLAVPAGQLEAALALGMSKAAALRRIIVPQAVRLVVPPVTNDFIALFKDTAICSVIAVKVLGQRELTGQYRNLAITNPQEIVQFALLTMALYLLMSYPLSLFARRLEKRVPHIAV